ncbi:MAG: spore germination protein [Oscillospiraceae bacterium]|jgi:spore germination protein KB|nr:spore germination protein [Oscillospiraceae bacterium]
MKEMPAITTTQTFVMLFIGQILLNLTYNPLLFSSENMWDHIVSTVLSFLAVFIIFCPIYFLYKRDPKTNIVKTSVNAFGKFGIIIALLYVLYYLFASCYSLCVFNIFTKNVMSPKTSLWLVSFAVGIASWYGASKGIEGLARACLIIFFMILASMIFLFCALTPRIDDLNYAPLMYEGTSSVFDGAMSMIAQNFCIPAVAVLFPFVKGNFKKGIFFWNISSHLFLASIIFLVVGSLGDYAKTQMFPIYTAVTVAEIGALKRMDSIFLGLWTTSLFCNISLFLFLISNIFENLWGKKAAKISLLFCALFISSFSAISSSDMEFLKDIYNVNIILGLTAVVTILLPCLLLLVKPIKTPEPDVNT